MLALIWYYPSPPFPDRCPNRTPEEYVGKVGGDAQIISVGKLIALARSEGDAKNGSHRRGWRKSVASSLPPKAIACISRAPNVARRCGDAMPIRLSNKVSCERP